MAEQPVDSNTSPVLKRLGLKPPGVLPRHIQTWLIVGISLLMVLIIAISGKSPKPSPTGAVVPSVPTDPSEARIREYRDRIDEQARRLAAEQAELGQAKTAFAQNSGAAVDPGTSLDLAPTIPPMPRERRWIEVEEEKREYEARFASNMAFSRREEKSAPQNDPTRDGSETSPSSATSKKDSAPLHTSEDGLYRLTEGTVMETTLTNRLDGSFSGPVNCMVTTDVYASDRMTLLIPAGSRVLGEAQRVEGIGQQRLAVAFHRLVLPNGETMSLDRFQGLNQIGETGLRDQVNNHYLQLFGVSVAIGAIAGLGQATTAYGATQTGSDLYVQGVASSLSQSSLRILDRFLNVLPTITIREGHRVKVYLSSDLLLPAYKKPVPHEF